jgi:hypothetical protein
MIARAHEKASSDMVISGASAQDTYKTPASIISGQKIASPTYPQQEYEHFLTWLC